MPRSNTPPHAAQRRLRPTGPALAAAAVLGGLLATGMAQAKTTTWTGAAPASDNWSANPNWDNGRPAIGDDLVFAGSNRLNNTLNISPLSFHSLSFSAGAGAFVINGTGALVTSAGNITNNSSNLQTLNASLIVGTSQTWAGGAAGLSFKGLSFASGAAAATVTGTGLIRSMGDITNNSSQLQTLATVVTLGAAQTWTGGAGGLAVDGLAGGGNLTLGSTTLNLGASGAAGTASTYAGSITAGSGGLVYSAASGSQTLTGAASQLAFLNIAQGALTLGGGALTVNGTGLGLDQTGGTLLINNGATVQFTNAVYNDIHGAKGTGVTVSGSGTTLQTSGWLDVGVRDHGSLVVTQGAQLNAQLVFVGRDSTGHGSLAVSAGGKVSVAGALQIGEFATGSGLVTLDGAGSALEAASIALGSSTYGGPGALVISNKASASADGALTFSNAASNLTVNGGSLWVGVLKGNQGTISLTDPFGVAALTVGGDSMAGGFAGVISGPGSLTKSGSGTQTLSGSGSTLGQLLVQGGQLTLSGGSLALTGPSTTPLQVLGGSLLVSDGQELSIGGHTGSFIDGFGTQAPALTVQGSGTQVLSGLPFMVGGVRSLSSTGSLSVQDGALFSASSLSAAGNGSTLRVDGAGSRLVVAGALNLGSDNADATDAYGTLTLSNGASATTGGATTLWTVGSRLVIDGGTLSTGSLAGVGATLSLTDPDGAPALTLTGTANGSFAGAISGSGSLLKTGAASQVLAGANTFTGTVTVNGGSLEMANGAASAYQVGSGGTLKLGYGTLGWTPVQADAGGTVVYNTKTLNGGLLIGNGTHDVSTVTRYNGTTVSNGVSLALANNAKLVGVSSAGDLSVASGRTVGWTGGSNAGGNLNVDGTANVVGWNSSGVLQLGTAGVLNVSGGNLVLLGGSRSYVGSKAAPGGSINLAAGSTVELNGALLVNNGTVNATTNVNFGSLAKGAGLYGAVNVREGGVFEAGNSPGTVTTGDTSWGAGGTYLVAMDQAAGTVGVNSGLWNINGTLALTAGAEGGHFTIRVATLNQADQAITLGDFNAGHNYSWLIANASGGITGYAPGLFSVDSSAFLNPLNGGSFSVAEVGNGLMLNFTSAVPEPSSAALMGAGALLLALARRRQGRGATGLQAASQR